VILPRRVVAPLATILVLTLPALSATPSDRTRVELDSLVAALRTSGCSFQRNGTWHDAVSAAEHLQKKREYLQGKGRIGTAEDFIRLGASESSMSGKSYQVRCPDKPIVPSKVWLERKLAALRSPRS
jgi:hypothetical protein